MSRIEPLAPEATTGRQQELLDETRQKLGLVPNLHRVLAHAPAALEFYLAQGDALAGGALEPRLREQIAVAVAGTNGCDYCASAHTALARNVGVSETEVADNLHGRASDDRTAAALAFVQRVVRERGRVSDADLAAVRDAGFSAAEIVEMLAHVGMNVFTNTFNHVVGTRIDFPVVRTAPARESAA